ncbi:hypothetical protein [Schaalia suimastitidis]|uniref:hypothetical protein n=1 Tax=Schaalia suimastitidis TaxID=121163 RepID=UPI00041A41FF|nr:hypothetical protein [Schaalia suimastitidis]
MIHTQGSAGSGVGTTASDVVSSLVDIDEAPLADAIALLEGLDAQLRASLSTNGD